ncbi:MAG: S-methyl-5'-thioinosine phosphorylase [Sedimenticola sp.]|jgi:5'-methylthioinosine phosphorylase|nr:MAG: S-methyl-5'-thioinosine phosphorylase [Sedimenticola sp.]
MTGLAIIGGSGFTSIKELKIVKREIIRTPFGETSAPLTYGILGDHKFVFLPRHGAAHTIPPHKVNYRANLWALSHIGIEKIVAVAAVGGIRKDMLPGSIAIPDQIIDYTYGRANTFYEDDLTHVTHIDFTEPYTESLRQGLLKAAEALNLDIIANGTYGATQGPRLETAQEINKLERDGCDLVGMTGMPEAALARELNLSYACCAVVANWGAGRNHGPILMTEIDKNLSGGMEKVKELLSILPSYI